ncbi:7TM diverse intracellular signaling domain-containing protein [Leptospira brenneri]|uniref:Serine/threonine protein phosphatase n=1 Tax=Leptospira brenneri TaxID=2023182 RepID=A0A2M9Y6Z3_9LEPT|nr:7TM diverse intracellular signaling domain-containing protein [Leptospira brenneri]PJZ47213.1 serine/threonine protein phosphatase [Leptospira brenneri]TGK95823.1 serine/threonine protein phosphatase [Leptospira brenneri]
MKQTFTFILLCLFYTNLSADSNPCPNTSIVPLSSTRGNPYDLSDHLVYFTQTPSVHSVTEVSNLFQTLPLQNSKGVIPNFGNTDKQYWFCFVVHNDENDYKRTITYIKYPLLDDVIFFALRESGEILENRQGRRFPFENRDRDYRGFSFATDLLPSETVTYFVGVKTDSSMSVPLMIAEEKNFYSFTSWDTLLQGIYFGIVGVMSIYNLFVYFMVRDKAYIFYVLYLCISAILFQLSLQGLLPVLFFPNSPELVYNSHNLLYFLFLLTCFPMSITFMNLKENAPYIRICFLGLMVISIICICLLPFLSYRFMNQAGDIFSFLLAFFALFVSYYVAFIKKFPPARFYFYGYFMVIIGGLATVLKYMGVLPVNAFTENSFQVGMAFEVLLMAFGLGDRISVVRKEKDRIQLKAEINKQKLIAYQKELVLAQKLQESTLPQVLPKIPGLKIKAGYIPQSLVGGDFYDVTEVSKNQIVCLMADVTGHGVPAAIEAAMLKIAHTHTLAFANGPGKILETINRSLVGIYKNQLLTAAAAHINLDAMELTVANAGHPAFYKFREDGSEIQIIRPKGKLIGFSKDVTYEEETHPLIASDRLLLFTDGLWDMWEKDKNGNKFTNDGSGEDVFLEWLSDHKHTSFETLFEKIETHIRRRMQTTSADDDITFLLIEIS